MTIRFIELSEDAFHALFPLLPNHLNADAAWHIDGVGACLFDTHGLELEFVRRQHPRSVWTFVEGDDDRQFLASGFHLVNRVGYLLSTMLLPEGVAAQVWIDDCGTP